MHSSLDCESAQQRINRQIAALRCDDRLGTRLRCDSHHGTNSFDIEISWTSDPMSMH
jgi:hypothetical protein